MIHVYDDNPFVRDGDDDFDPADRIDMMGLKNIDDIDYDDWYSSTLSAAVEEYP